MEEKFKVLITVGLTGKAQARMSVTESEYEMLCNLSKIINDPWQEDFSPNMYVEKVNDYMLDAYGRKV